MEAKEGEDLMKLGQNCHRVPLRTNQTCSSHVQSAVIVFIYSKVML